MTVTTVPVSPTAQLRPQTSALEASARPAGSRSWVQEMFNYPDVTGSIANARSSPKNTVIVTGSVGATKEPAKEAKKKDAKDANNRPRSRRRRRQGRQAAGGEGAGQGRGRQAHRWRQAVDLAARPDGLRSVSTAERAILERLLERRQELDTKARELELRENLLKAAEKNLEAKLAAQRAEESGANGQRGTEAEAARFKGLITMYETMKPKEAAKIFDRLEIKVLAEVAGQINPRRMSEIMAQMTPETAERLTLEFAVRSDADKSQKPPELPRSMASRPAADDTLTFRITVNAALNELA